VIERRFWADLGYLPTVDHDPAVWRRPAARAVDQRAGFDNEDTVRGRAHGLSKNLFATYTRSSLR
jgi:hypothetical protein